MFDRRQFLKALGATAVVTVLPVAANGHDASAATSGTYAIPDGGLSVELFDGDQLVKRAPLRNIRAVVTEQEARFFADDLVWQNVTMAATRGVIVFNSGFPLRIPMPQIGRIQSIDDDFHVRFSKSGAAVIEVS